MITGIGTDIIEVKRIEQSIERYGQRFLDRIFSLKEQAYCLKHRDSGRHFAGRFAAKESVAKALGTGFTEGLGWLDIEIGNEENGKPEITLSKQVALAYHSPRVHLTISHSKDYAVAFAICES